MGGNKHCDDPFINAKTVNIRRKDCRVFIVVSFISPTSRSHLTNSRRLMTYVSPPFDGPPRGIICVASLARDPAPTFIYQCTLRRNCSYVSHLPVRLRRQLQPARIKLGRHVITPGCRLQSSYSYWPAATPPPLPHARERPRLTPRASFWSGAKQKIRWQISESGVDQPCSIVLMWRVTADSGSPLGESDAVPHGSISYSRIPSVTWWVNLLIRDGNFHNQMRPKMCPFYTSSSCFRRLAGLIVSQLKYVYCRVTNCWLVRIYMTKG
jgi:hypothetical protein